MKKIKFLLFSFLLVFAGHSFAVVYKCVDAQGKKTFTDSECEKLALKYLNPPVIVPKSIQTPASAPSPLLAMPIVYFCVDAQSRRVSSDVECEKHVPKYFKVPLPGPVPVHALPVKLSEKRLTNFGYIWSGSGYTGFLRYFFIFVGGGAFVFLLFYLVLFVQERLRKRTSGIADAKS